MALRSVPLLSQLRDLQMLLQRSMRVTSSLTATNTGVTISDATVNGTLTGATVDLNSGNIDGTIIGATTAAAGTFTDITVASGTGDSVMTIDANSTSDTSDIKFDVAGVNKGYIRYQHDDGEKLKFSVGGSEKLFIKGNGRVGIGTSSPGGSSRSVSREYGF